MICFQSFFYFYLFLFESPVMGKVPDSLSVYSMYMYVYIHGCMCACMYIYMYKM